MGILDGLGVGLSAIGEQRQAERTAEQNFLMQLVTQVPELMQNPQIAQSVQGAFPTQRGIPQALGGIESAMDSRFLKQRQLALAQAQMEEDMALASEVEKKAALLGVGNLFDQIDSDTPRDDLLGMMSELSDLERERAKAEGQTSASAELANDLFMEMAKHKNRMELEGVKQGSESNKWNAIGSGLRAIGSAIGGADKLVETPRMTPFAEEASKARTDVLRGRLSLEKGRLLQVVELDKMLRDDEGDSPGVENLYRLLQTNRNAFESTFGLRWQNAKETAAQTLQTPELQQAILSRPEVSSIYNQLLTDYEDGLRAAEASPSYPSGFRNGPTSPAAP